MRYGNPSQRSKAISLYILIFAVVIGIIIYWMNFHPGIFQPCFSHTLQGSENRLAHETLFFSAE